NETTLGVNILSFSRRAMELRVAGHSLGSAASAARSSSRPNRCENVAYPAIPRYSQRAADNWLAASQTFKSGRDDASRPPTRLADGLGLESTPVQRLNLRPVGSLGLTRLEAVSTIPIGSPAAATFF